MSRQATWPGRDQQWGGVQGVATIDPRHITVTAGESLKPFAIARAGPVLALWVGLMIALHTVLWATGFEPKALSDAVDRGAARAEISRVGEVGDDVVRKAIKLQRETLPFWTTIAHLGDFGVEPAILLGRTVAVATLFAVIAALSGRPIGFMAGLKAAAWTQGFWVLVLALKVSLMVGLRRPDVETSAALLLAPGRYPAALVLLARQADPCVVLGWLALARGGWQRGQVNLATALFVCLSLAVSETMVRVSCGLIAGAGMRLSVLPR